MSVFGEALIRSGRTLLRRQHGLHLWLVITDPHGDPAEVVVVMLTTLREHSDTTLILNPGDHPFVKHETSVNFSTAVRVRVDRILCEMNVRACTLGTDMSRDLLERVRDALLVSPFTILAVAEYCKQRLGRQ